MATHVMCGGCALVVVLFGFLGGYSLLVSASRGLGVPATTALVWSFIAAWLVGWLALATGWSAWRNRQGSGSPAGDAS